jgi:HEPN domain-containing protein
LAERSLERGRDNHQRRQWRDSALFSRASVEHAAKAILACFAAVPRTHEPARLLRAALEAEGFPAELRARAGDLLAELEGFGMQEHILLSYGDEEHGIDPWSMVDEVRATGHLRIAHATTALARECVGATLGGDDSKTI